jgi:thioredoxin reductase (NADPH)
METAAAPVDVLVVGAGPVGLACALEASRQGLSHVVVERGALLNTLVRWPTHTVFFSTPELLEIGGHPFVTASGKPTRREGLAYYRKVAEREGLEIRLHESVLSVTGSEGLFRATTTKGVRAARAVVVATGFFDTPNLLDVPGEDLPKVSHYYTEPFAHAKTDVLVVGGKNSAVEAALDLYRNGARVTMAVRKAEFGASVKYWLKPDIENRVKEGSIRAHFDTRVAGIEEDRVVLETSGRAFAIPNDFVFALTGYRPDFSFLRALGIAVTDDLHVVHDAGTMETNVPGLYVAGVVAAGIDIGKLFIENGRLHAVAIVKHLLARRGTAPAAPLAAPEIRRFQDGD